MPILNIKGGSRRRWLPQLIGVLIASAAGLCPKLRLPEDHSVRRKSRSHGTTIHVRIAGSGPAVVLLHGYGETGDM